MGKSSPASPVGPGERFADPAGREGFGRLAAARSVEDALWRFAEISARAVGADCAYVVVARRGRRAFWWPTEGERSPGRWRLDHRETDVGFDAWLDSRGAALVADTLALGDPTPRERAAIAAGVRSMVRVPLEDERGRLLGFVLAGAGTPGRFAQADLERLLGAAAQALGVLRPRFLIERLDFERKLRSAEADLLAQVASADDEETLLRQVVTGVRAALEVDAVLVLVEGGPGGRWTFRADPAGLITPQLLDDMLTAALDPGNRPMLVLQQGRAWARESLGRDDLLPAERFARDRLQMGSLATAVRVQRPGGLGTAVVALRREPGPWSGPELGLLARLAPILEVGVERIRRGELAVAHALSLERQAELLSVGAELLERLWEARELGPACQAIAERLRVYFGADHVLLATVDLERRRREILGLSSDLLTTGDLKAELDEADVERFRRELADVAKPRGDVFAAPAANPATAFGQERGLRSGIRVPFLLSDGTMVVVTVASREPGRLGLAEEERLVELARTLTVAIDRVRLLAQMAETSEMLAAKTRLLLALGPGASIREAGDVFVEEVRRLFGASLAVVVTTGPGDGPTVSSAAGLPEAGDSGGLAASWLGPEEWQALIAGGPALIDDARTANDPAARFFSERGLSSAMRAPIPDSTGIPRGIATVAAPAAGRWDAEDLAQFAELAATLGTVLEGALRLDGEAEQARRADAMLNLLSALGPERTLEGLARRAAAGLRRLFAADACTIGMVEGPGVRLLATDSPVAEGEAGAVLPLAEVFDVWPPAGPVVHLLDGLADAPRPTGASLAAQKAAFRSSMAAAIVDDEGVCGVVTLGARAAGRFGPRDAAQLAEAVRPLALAIRLFQGREEQARRTARLEATNRILARLNAGGTAARVAHRFLVDARAMFGAQLGIVFTFEPGQATARRLAIDSSLSLPREATAAELPASRIGRARPEEPPAPQLVADAREEPELDAVGRALAEAGLLSAIRAPLVVHEKVRGEVALWRTGAGRFAPDDAELLATLAQPLALALDKAAALESLAESELKYRSLVAQAEEMILTVDAKSRRILDANPFAARVLGYGPRELQNLRLDDISMAGEAELAAFIARIHADGEVHLGDVHYRKRDGTPVDVEVVASLVTFGGREAVLVLAREVSERKALMAQLMQSQKMESLGTMAGAVAHDFNNLLTTILGFASLVKRSPNLDPDERESVALIEEAARKAADLTGRLLAFARGGLVRFGQVDLRTVVEDTLQLVAPAIHSRIALRVELPETPVLVEGDHGQLQQALTNVVLNARDVMPDGGSIAIRVGTTGPIAWVEIADSGPGMTDDVRMRIFEPFFTTKPPGSGTGLGMAITYGIVQGHHGDITVESQPGKGTTFTLSFPRVAGEALAGGANAFNPGEGNLVLVVDDDAMARRAMAATLGELGYNVVEAPGGATAVEIVRARPDRFAAVLLDLVMPGMTGAETFRALTEIRPDLPVIVCTGYAPDSHIDTDAKRRIAGLIQKPFTPERLVRALEAAGARPLRR